MCKRLDPEDKARLRRDRGGLSLNRPQARGEAPRKGSSSLLWEEPGERGPRDRIPAPLSPVSPARQTQAVLWLLLCTSWRLPGVELGLRPPSKAAAERAVPCRPLSPSGTFRATSRERTSTSTQHPRAGWQGADGLLKVKDGVLSPKTDRNQ